MGYGAHSGAYRVGTGDTFPSGRNSLTWCWPLTLISTDIKNVKLHLHNPLSLRSLVLVSLPFIKWRSLEMHLAAVFILQTDYCSPSQNDLPPHVLFLQELMSCSMAIKSNTIAPLRILMSTGLGFACCRTCYILCSLTDKLLIICVGTATKFASCVLCISTCSFFLLLFPPFLPQLISFTTTLQLYLS